jgi:transposase
MKAEEVAEFLHQIAAELEKRDIKKVMFFIDNNSTHKIKMRYNLALLPKLNIEIQICYLPPYSPKINLVEYLIPKNLK